MNYLGGASSAYETGDGAVLRSYTGKGEDEFLSLCAFLEAQGWEPISSLDENNSRFTTYSKGNGMYHIYLPSDRADTLRVVHSDEENLPDPILSSAGTLQTTVTQLMLPQDEENVWSNGMGYVIHLSDGSFLLFDGGYAGQADQLWQTLVAQNGGEEGIVIRAWCLTHAHGDHYGIMQTFADRYANRLTVERFFAAPVNLSDASDPFFNNSLPGIIAQFEGASLCVPHTGMTFSFCELTLEILLSPDELLIDGKPQNFDFNSSGVVYRLYDSRDSLLILGDALRDVTDRLQVLWGDHLRANMVQVAHHGVGNSPVEFYESLNASVLFYPAGHRLYGGAENNWGQGEYVFGNNWNRNGAVRRALEESGKYEILLHDVTAYIRVWGSEAPAQEFTLS